MGIVAAIGSAVAIVKGTEQVAKKLNQKRTVLIQVYNHTDHTLRMVSHEHSSGDFAVPPSQRIPPGSVDIFGSQDRAWSIATGAVGSITYAIGDTNTTATIRWSNPFFGKNSGSATARGKNARDFQMTGIVGAGLDAQARYEVLPRTDTSPSRRGGSASPKTGEPIHLK